MCVPPWFGPKKWNQADHVPAELARMRRQKWVTSIQFGGVAGDDGVLATLDFMFVFIRSSKP
jgi:hypothetical protein